MLSENKKEFVKKIPKKITPQRLKNIALFYLKRFETSETGLKNVLKRRVDDYAYFDKDFDKFTAYQWIDDLVADFVRLKYVDNERFAEIKIRGYLAAGKSPRYILIKLREKGIDDILANKLLGEQEFDEFESALKLAKKKKIGPFLSDLSVKRERRNKDLAILIRAGFNYDIALKVLDWEEV